MVPVGCRSPFKLQSEINSWDGFPLAYARMCVCRLLKSGRPELNRHLPGYGSAAVDTPSGNSSSYSDSLNLSPVRLCQLGYPVVGNNQVTGAGFEPATDENVTVSLKLNLRCVLYQPFGVEGCEKM